MTLMLDLHLYQCHTAVVSPCGRYRYRLGRRWGPGPAVMFISLNPSTAGERIDDATIRRDKRCARGYGYDARSALNLYRLRSTDPKRITRVVDPGGPDNDAHLDAAAAERELKIVFAWGVHAQPARVRAVRPGSGGSARAWRHRGGAGLDSGWSAEASVAQRRGTDTPTLIRPIPEARTSEMALRFITELACDATATDRTMP